MRRTLAITALAGALALLPSSAWGSGNDVIRDCTDNGRIDNQHGPRDYQEALANLPSDVDEYTDCRQIIQAARLGDQGGGGGGGGGGGQGGGGGGGGGGPGGGSSAQAARRTMPVVKGAPITPPASRLASHPVPERIPTSVIILLAVLGVALLGGLLAAATGFKAPTPVVRIVDRVFPRRA